MGVHQIDGLDTLADDPLLAPFLSALTERVVARHRAIYHADKKGRGLAETLRRMPGVMPSSIDTDRDRIRIGRADDLSPLQAASLSAALFDLKPWRKGPFDIFGIRLESEWDSSAKWNRLADHLGPQTGKRVLDIGASCGYYMFRLAVRKPALVLGIEPYLTFYFQYRALSRYLALPRICCLPLRLEELPVMRRCFDTVLCMGILYHRRSPLDTLSTIHSLMAPGGQLILETLILEGDAETALFPAQRYAGMKNIFFIPTVRCLTHWLRRCGFEGIRCVDISRTTVNEQRKTAWIDGQSLEDFLNPADPDKTIEGYPAPMRAMILARASAR